MMAGNWKSYSDFARQTDYLDPRSRSDGSKEALEDAWNSFSDAYKEKYGKQTKQDRRILKNIWDRTIVLSDEGSDSGLLEMSIDEMIKEGMDVRFWYDKYERAIKDKILKTHDFSIKPLLFKEWREQFYDNRLEAMIGFNTKQLWIYDDVRDVFIDPPAEVLDSLPDWREDSEKAEEALLEICKSEPEWLFDREYWYDDEDFEI